MNTPAAPKTDVAASDHFTDSGVSEGEDTSEEQCLSRFYCRACNYTDFKSRYQFEQHLLRHVSTPSIVVERLGRSDFRRSVSRKAVTTPRKLAPVKSVSSYIVPKIKSKNSPLKLTLKLSGETGNKERSFEVVTPRTVLLGPGECFALNGGPLECIKTEQESSSQEVEKHTVSGVEGPGEEVPAPEQSSGAEQAQEDSQQPRSGSASPEEGGTAQDTSTQNTAEESNKAETDNFVPPEGSFSPNMVQVNNGALVDHSQSCSPDYPSTSPNLPDGEQHLSQHCDGDATNSGDSHHDTVAEENSNCREGTPSLVNEDSHHTNSNFSWADVSSTGMEGLSSNSQPQEERDPLMLPEQGQQGMMQLQPYLQGDENAGSILGLGGPPPDAVGVPPGGDSSDPLLRGFLCEQPPAEKTAVPVAVSEAGNMESLGLGSEYISLERLGDGNSQVSSGSFYCDVCGERAPDHSALEDHRTRACHYKCTHSDCGGMVLATADELLAHQNACHGGPPPPPPPPQYIHAVPVEQLSQPVQRLPPPVSMSQPPQHLPTSQQQYVPQGSPEAIRRPTPPLMYMGHSPNQLSPQPPPPPYGQQMVYGQQQQQQQQPQPAPQQQYHPQPQFQPIPTQQLQQQPPPPPPPQQQQQQQQQNRAYSMMQQQQQQSPHRVQQAGSRMAATTVVRGGAQMTMAQKRAVGQVPVGGQGASPNKQRRLDVLLPDRHEDPDCHVIAIQKPTETGPLITSVQGSMNNTNRSEMIQLTDSITLSVRNQKQVGGVNGGQVVGGRGRNKANEVANVLASRGITVTPAADTSRGGNVQAQTSPLRGGNNRGSVAQNVQQQVPTLNLNAAISIIRTDNGGGSPVRQRQRPAQPTGTASFAVPQGRSPGRPQQLPQVERPPRPPTVDLTGDNPPSALHHLPMRRGRGRGANLGGRFTCQICDKQFASQETLNQHMNITHRSPPNKLPYRCNLCSAQYPTQQGLTQHRQTFHKESLGNTELVIPVVDLKQAGALSRLANLGVHHYVPLSQLNSPQGGYFGLPLMSVDASGRVLGSVPGMTGLSTGTVFNLGPLRQLPR